jgi:tRNA(Arg) A34 adenosine deaminase TadA
MPPADLAAKGLRVKPLVWRPWGYGDEIAESPFGSYMTWEGHWRAPEHHGGTPSNTPRAHAEAHHAARVAEMIEATE